MEYSQIGVPPVSIPPSCLGPRPEGLPSSSAQQRPEGESCGDNSTQQASCHNNRQLLGHHGGRRVRGRVGHYGGVLNHGGSLPGG